MLPNGLNMSRRRCAPYVWLRGRRTTRVPRDGFSTSPLRKPPRVHAPCIGRVTGAGRSPDLRVAALLRLPGKTQWHHGETLAAHSCGGSSGLGSIENLTGFPFGRPRPGDGTPVPSASEREGLLRVNGRGQACRDFVRAVAEMSDRDIPQQRHVLVTGRGLHDVTTGWKGKMIAGDQRAIGGGAV